MQKKAFGTYDIAKICHVTPSSVGHWIEKGLLPTFTTGGGHRRVWAKDLVTFLKAHNIPVPGELQTLSSPQVLIVDDEDQVRKVIRRTIKKYHPQVEIHEAVDGFEAGQKVTQLLPSLVILDLRLPGIDGLKVCKIIRSDERLRNTRILAISGYTPEESEKQSFNAGADDFLRKPFDINELKEKIAGLLEAQDKRTVRNQGGKN